MFDKTRKESEPGDSSYTKRKKKTKPIASINGDVRRDDVNLT